MSIIDHEGKDGLSLPLNRTITPELMSAIIANCKTVTLLSLAATDGVDDEIVAEGLYLNEIMEKLCRVKKVMIVRTMCNGECHQGRHNQ